LAEKRLHVCRRLAGSLAAIVVSGWFFLVAEGLGNVFRSRECDRKTDEMWYASKDVEVRIQWNRTVGRR
jgi:hypothetical protein